MKKSTPKADPYLKMIREHWAAITGMYVAFEDRRPIIEFDVVNGQILAYPAMDYVAGLTDRTRERTKEQYRKAVDEGALMLFVRDASKRVLRSYIFPSA